MSTAGINRYDQETQFAYFKYCQEYYTAWIEYLPEMEEAIRKFDGKKVTKRIETAIGKINPHLFLRIDKSISWQTRIFFEWYDSNAREFHDEKTGQWNYVAGTSGRGNALMFFVDDAESFDAEKFIKELHGYAQRQTEAKNDVLNAISNFETIKRQYNEAVEALEKAEDAIPDLIKRYYEIPTESHKKWN